MPEAFRVKKAGLIIWPLKTELEYYFVLSGQSSIDMVSLMNLDASLLNKSPANNYTELKDLNFVSQVLRQSMVLGNIRGWQGHNPFSNMEAHGFEAHNSEVE